jgi:hypothetical protein
LDTGPAPGDIGDLLSGLPNRTKGEVPVLWWIVLIILFLLLLGAIPAWPYSRRWGYGPSGILGLLFIILLILLLAEVL